MSLTLEYVCYGYKWCINIEENPLHNISPRNEQLIKCKWNLGNIYLCNTMSKSGGNKETVINQGLYYALTKEE